MATRSLEEILAQKKLITQEQLSSIRLESINTGDSVEEIIRRRQLVPEEAMSEAKAELLGIPYITLTNQIPAEALATIPQATAEKYSAVPFELSKDGIWLSVAMADPLDLQLIEFLERKSNKRIKPYMASAENIAAAIKAQYSSSLTTEVTAALKEVGSEAAGGNAKNVPAEDTAKELKIERDAPVAQIVSTLLEYGIKMRASDIHIEPLEDRTRVRYRIDGILQEKLSLHKALHDAIVSRIKILSGMKIDEKRIPQDGRFNFKVGNEEIDLRVSTLPVVYNEKIVMRLLKKTGGVPTLADLGLRGMALKHLQTQMLRPHGVILITGPTGSGKTTTLYSILTQLNTDRVNIVTLEDPVEYQMPGVNQVQINSQVGLTFADGLRSFLRQDPNIIMVGEIRDKETTELAIQAALTGHLVFSTLHTNTAAGSLPRLLDLGAEPFLIASAVNCVEAQRVVRRVCENCREQFVPPEPVMADIKNVLGKLYASDKKTLVKGKGCNHCNNTGYLGRIGIYEVLPISEQLAKLVLEHAPLNEIEKEAEAEGMITMKQDGYMKALEGITTIEEVLRVAQD